MLWFRQNNYAFPSILLNTLYITTQHLVGSIIVLHVSQISVYILKDKKHTHWFFFVSPSWCLFLYVCVSVRTYMHMAGQPW